VPKDSSPRLMDNLKNDATVSDDAERFVA